MSDTILPGAGMTAFGVPADGAGIVSLERHGEVEPVVEESLRQTGALGDLAAGPDPAIDLSVTSDLAALEAEWRAFAPEAAATAFQAFDWLAKWQRHIGSEKGTLPAIVVGRDRLGGLLLILPLAIERTGPVRRLTWLASELCDYNAPLLAPKLLNDLSGDRFKALWRDVIALLRAESRFRFDIVDLQKMPETIRGLPNPFLSLAVSVHPSGAYVATLGPDWDAFYAARRSSATRKRERRQLNQLTEHGGEVRLVTADDPASAAATVEALFEQKSSWLAHRGAEDMFGRRGYRAFYRDVATDPRLGDLVHLSRLDVGGIIAAANIGLTFGGSYYLISSSYLAGDLSQYGTGRFHLQLLLRRAIDKGFARFDFTVGDEAYKHDWADIEVKLYDLVGAVGPRGMAFAAGVTGYRRLKRTIKQNPTLWRLFSRARAAAGKLSFRRHGRA